MAFPDRQTKLLTKILPGVTEKLSEWDSKDYQIILVTGRKESEREATENQLAKIGIQYDVLLMGPNRGQRVLINDTKLDSDEPAAIAINVIRNNGIADIKI